jgi:anti-sigma factor RsiW
VKELRMAFNDEMLSAFLDGALPAAQMAEIEAALAQDADLLARLEALMAGNELAKIEFEEMLSEDVPADLIAAIETAPEPAANTPQAPSRSGALIAASIAGALALGGIGGFYAAGFSATTQVAATGGWLADIADYHGVYAKQVRHLVEVPASEADHIQTWLTATVGTDILIPDLSGHGLKFQGARLLVAAGKPVAQLIYTDPEQGVVALCAIASASPQPEFQTRTLGAFDLVSWGDTDANFVIVGDEGRVDLDAIAQTAAKEV